MSARVVQIDETREMRAAIAEAERKIRDGEGWEDATPALVVGLYSRLHQKCYGVAPLELADAWSDACDAAGAMLASHPFVGDASRIVEFLRWVWRRERDLEGRNHCERRRVGWRLQFASRELVTDWLRGSPSARSVATKTTANENGGDQVSDDEHDESKADEGVDDAAVDDRPEIDTSRDLHQVVDDAIAALAGAADLYQRDGALIRIVRVAESEADATAHAGTPQLRALTSPTLREVLSRCARWGTRDKKGKWHPAAAPPDTVTSAVLARAEYPGVRPVVGVIECPTLRPDGSLLSEPGYDAATAYVYEPDAAMRSVSVPDAPSRDDAAKALAELVEPIEELPWRTDADRGAAIAALLTLVARPAIRGAVPAVVFDANTPGAGKTLCTHVIAIVATGRAAAMAHWPPDDTELAKALGAYALRGAPLVSFDNISRPFGGSSLDRCLTAVDSVELRVLGRSEVPSMRWRALVLGTGNGIEVEGDTARRVLVARLESPHERPEERTGYRHADLLAYVATERPRLVRAALVVLRAFVVAGRPAMRLRPWGSYEAWTSLVPAAIVHAGGADPMRCRLAGDERPNPEQIARRAILAGWMRLAPDGMTVRAAVGYLYRRTVETFDFDVAVDGYEDLREAIEAVVPTQPGRPPSPAKLGVLFRRWRRRVLGNAMLDGEVDRTGTIVWRVVPAEDAGDVSRAEGAAEGSSAGDAGHAGHKSKPSRATFDPDPDLEPGEAVKSSPACPASPADASSPSTGTGNTAGSTAGVHPSSEGLRPPVPVRRRRVVPEDVAVPAATDAVNEGSSPS